MKPLSLASYTAILTCLVLIFTGLFIDDLIQRRRVRFYQNQAASTMIILTNIVNVQNAYNEARRR